MITFGCPFLESARKRGLGSLSCVGIVVANDLGIVEELPTVGYVCWTELCKLPLALVPIKRSIVVAVMEYSPQLLCAPPETG